MQLSPNRDNSAASQARSCSKSSIIRWRLAPVISLSAVFISTLIGFTRKFTIEFPEGVFRRSRLFSSERLLKEGIWIDGIRNPLSITLTSPRLSSSWVFPSRSGGSVPNVRWLKHKCNPADRFLRAWFDAPIRFPTNRRPKDWPDGDGNWAECCSWLTLNTVCHSQKVNQVTWEVEPGMGSWGSGVKALYTSVNKGAINFRGWVQV